MPAHWSLLAISLKRFTNSSLTKYVNRPDLLLDTNPCLVNLSKYLSAVGRVTLMAPMTWCAFV